MSFLALLRNSPCCTLPCGVEPFPPCHASPPQHVWRSFDGTELPFTFALPDTGVPKGIVLIVPGTDSVTSDYASVIEEVLRHGYGVYGCENRTFRYGPEHSRGDARNWQPWVEDLRGFSRFVHQRHPGVPIFWHGHSFGGVQILQTAADSEAEDLPAGLIVHSPGFGLMFRQATFLRGLSYGIFAWLRVPWTRLIEVADLPMSDDPVFDCRWKHSDDRVREGIKVRYFIQAANMGIAARNSSPHLKLPVLALWGGRDRQGLGGNEKLRAEYNHYMQHELAGGRAALFYREQALHLLTEGSTKQDALTAIIGWLAALS